MSELAVEYAGLSVVGLVRERNEDRLGWVAPGAGSPCVTPAGDAALPAEALASPTGFVFAVADGLGAYGGGDVASDLAVSTSLAHVARNPPDAGRVTGALRRAFAAANQAIFDAAIAGLGGRKMQSTLSALVVTPGEAHLGHVGDCRVYRRRETGLELLTTDHSQVMELLRLRIVTPEQAIEHPARYALTRSVGGDITVRVDVRSERLAAGDTFLLCSDGLWSNVTSSDIAAALSLAPEDACERLVRLALERGGDDNATAMTIRVSVPGERPEATPGWRRFFS